MWILLKECTELLVQVQPKDHIQFLKNILPCAAMKRNKQRIVFLSPASFDREAFAEMVADCLGIQNISLMGLELLTKDKLTRLATRVESSEKAVEEEESCICPGEGGEFSPFLPVWAEETPYFSPDEKSESVEEEEEEEEEQQQQQQQQQEQKSCVCVCPCVKVQGKEDEEEGGGEGEGGEGEGGEGEGGEGEGGEGEGYPCPPKTHSKKLKKEESTLGDKDFTIAGSESSKFELDYGILAECEVSSKGWILQDFPGSGEEAESLCATGVIPTHALRIILNEEEETKNKDYFTKVRKWKEVYRHIPVTEIRKGERNVEELAKDLCKLFSIMPHRHPPMQLRVVLIGSRGSGTTTQGQELAKKYGVVHVEFETVMTRALEQDDEICKLYKIQLNTRPEPEVEAILLERALLTPACRKRGWVLTGYPKNIDQMRMFDLIATPPNRIIFIEVPPKECFVRLYYRKTDSFTGDRHKIPEIQPAGLDSFEAPNLSAEVKERLFSCKNDSRKQIIHDIEQYFLEKNEIKAYCDETASFVDGDNTVDAVFQMVEQIIINPSPARPPREPVAIGYGMEESYQRLQKFRLANGMYFNNLFLNPPEKTERYLSNLPLNVTMEAKTSTGLPPASHRNKAKVLLIIN